MYLEWKWRLGKLRVLSGKQVCAILAYHGFIEMWQRGSPECILYFQATSFIYFGGFDRRSIQIIMTDFPPWPPPFLKGGIVISGGGFGTRPY